MPSTARQAPPFPSSGRTALLFDLDGTLAPLAGTPDAVRSDPGRSALLRRLAALLDGRLAVISGRTVAEVDRILDGSLPVVSGVHGLEMRTSAGIRRAEPHHGIVEALRAFRDMAAGDPGLLVEDKGASVTLHYRNAPACADRALALAERLAGETGLVLQRGSMVVELRTPGADKGDALAAIMAEPGFAGSVPYFFGDDLTDESAFAAAARLGGKGVLIGPDRPSAARFALSGVAELMAWLRRLLEAAQEKGDRRWAG